jgi:D-hexose-6-phosphate mutarotase
VEAAGLALRGGLGVVAGWFARIGRHKQPRLGDRQG